MDNPSNNLLSGSESFTISNQPAGFSVIDFWRFQFSNIWDIQDQIAEFIVELLLMDIANSKKILNELHKSNIKYY